MMSGSPFYRPGPARFPLAHLFSPPTSQQRAQRPSCRLSGDMPWAFAHGKGVFSTPVHRRARDHLRSVPATHLLRSAPGGTVKWKYKTERSSIRPLLYVISTRNPVIPSPLSPAMALCTTSRTGEIKTVAERLVWKFEPSRAPASVSTAGSRQNVAIGPDVPLCRNTNFNYYAIHPNGRLK